MTWVAEVPTTRMATTRSACSRCSSRSMPQWVTGRATLITNGEPMPWYIYFLLQWAILVIGGEVFSSPWTRVTVEIAAMSVVLFFYLRTSMGKRGGSP